MNKHRCFTFDQLLILNGYEHKGSWIHKDGQVIAKSPRGAAHTVDEDALNNFAVSAISNALERRKK